FPSLLCLVVFCVLLLLFTATPPSDISTLSLHDALPILDMERVLHTTHFIFDVFNFPSFFTVYLLCEIYSVRIEFFAINSNIIVRSEEHTSELQSRFDLVCRLLLEKKYAFIYPKPVLFVH